MLICEDLVDQKVSFDIQLMEGQENQLKMFLFNNKNVFALSTNDLAG